MSNKEKDVTNTHIAEGLIAGMLIGTLTAVLINIFFGFNNAWWAWTTFPGVGLMVGLLIGMNIKKEGK